MPSPTPSINRKELEALIIKEIENPTVKSQVSTSDIRVMGISSTGMSDIMFTVMKLIDQYSKAYAEKVIGEDEAPKPNPRSKDSDERRGTCWACFEQAYCDHAIRDGLRSEQRAKLNQSNQEPQL